jgi:hypothetical protein
MLEIILIKLLFLLFDCEFFVFNCSRIQLKTGVVARSFNFISAFWAFKLAESGPNLSPLE